MYDRRALIARRRRNLLLAALAAFVLGIVVGAVSDRGDGGRPAAVIRDELAAPGAGDRTVVDRLTVRQQVGQLIVLRFAGTTPPAYVLDALRERRAAGVILFRDNVTAPEQLRALTRRLRRAGGRPLVAVDQEGGEIRIVPWAPPAASAPEQARAGSAGFDAEAAASALRAAGITVSLAPVGDVPSVAGAALGARAFSDDADAASAAMTAAVNGWRAGGVAATAKHFPGLGGATVNTDDAPATVTRSRAFSDDPETAAEAMAAAVRGWRAGGVAPTAKHFPGLGGATVNTDDGPATIDRSRAELEAVDLPPFAAAVDAGVPLVMIGHASYPALDPERVASQSPPILGDLLRGDLGFRGVVVTDSMEAAASLATGSVTAVSERAVRAGADLLLLTGQGSFAPVSRHLLATARDSAGFRLRVRESAARVLALRAGSGDTPAP